MQRWLDAIGGDVNSRLGMLRCSRSWNCKLNLDSRRIQRDIYLFALVVLSIPEWVGRCNFHPRNEASQVEASDESGRCGRWKGDAKMVLTSICGRLRLYSIRKDPILGGFNQYNLYTRIIDDNWWYLMIDDDNWWYLMTIDDTWW